MRVSRADGVGRRAAVWSLLLPAVAAVLPLGGWTTQEASAPDATALLRRATALTRTVQRVHADGTIQMTHTRNEPGKNPRFRANLAVTGDCDGTFASLSSFHEAAAFRVSGQWTIAEQPPETLDVHYVTIVSANHLGLWQRSAATRNVWAVPSGHQSESLEGQNDQHVFVWVCPAITMNLFFAGGAPPHLRALGPVALNGHLAWDLQSVSGQQGGTIRYDFFVDRLSGRLLRFVQRAHNRTLGGSTLTFTYSHFNQQVHVVRPRLGSATP